MAAYNEVHPSRNETGTLEVSRVVIAGFENALHAKSTDGAIWFQLSGTTLTAYRRKTAAGAFAAGDSIMTATVSSVPTTGATLSQANTSGWTGTIDVTGGEGIARCQVSYCDESDVKLLIPYLTSWLDGSSQMEGVSRFLSALQASKRKVDELIRGRIAKLGSGIQKTGGQIDVLTVARPGMFREVQAKFTAAILLEWAANAAATDYLERAEAFEKSAYEYLNRTPIEIDTDDDGYLEARTDPYSSSLIRV